MGILVRRVERVLGTVVDSVLKQAFEGEKKRWVCAGIHWYVH
jgi:hypothetical protein